MAEIRVEVLRPLIIKRADNGKIDLIMVLLDTLSKKTCSMRLNEYMTYTIKHLMEHHTISDTPFNLITDILKKDNASVARIVVDRILDDKYYRATIHVKRSSGAIYKLDTTPAEAAIIALMENCPLFVEDSFLAVDDWINELLESVQKLEDEDALLRPASDVPEDKMLEILSRFKENKDKKPN